MPIPYYVLALQDYEMLMGFRRIRERQDREYAEALG